MDEDGAFRSEPQPRREEVEEQTYRQNDATVRMKKNDKKMTKKQRGRNDWRGGDACVCV